MRLQLREHCSAAKRRAHQLLDDLQAGISHDQRSINWALAVLGEPVEES